MIINHNMSAFNADRVLNFKAKDVDKSMEKLASGLKINKGADDASNLAVSEKMRSQIRGLNQAAKNIENGISFVQTAEGYLTETTDLIQRLRELAVQSANGIYGDDDRKMIDVEVAQLKDEINRVAEQGQFNGMNILSGRYANANGSQLFLHVGANVNQREVFYIEDMTAKGLGIDQVSLDTGTNANTNIEKLDKALSVVTRQRADLGGYQNRFEFAVKGVRIAQENLQATESIIRDTNMANQVVEYVKDNILVQSGTAMLAQANTKPQSVLQLLG